VVWACITRDQWVAIWTAQGGCCGICLTPLRNRYDTKDKKKQIASLDHRHATERDLLAEGADPMEALRRSVRGLLCYFCNRNVVGMALRDNPDKAQRAADYLRDPPAKKVLKCS
jgi:hypothetical protein